MSKTDKFGEGFRNLPDTSFIKCIELINTRDNLQLQVENCPGKQASVKIIHAITQVNKNLLTSVQAKEGLQLFGDYVQLERQSPNSHPNIRLLLDTIDHNQTWLVKVVSHNEI